jgi:glycosyltransferase involved in cell wall biosynthesis
MNKYDLSILIPARNEEWLSQTVKGILENKRGNTEVLVGLDGAWANPGIPDHPDVTIIYYPEAIGQRAMTNQLCKLSKAKWVMKCDAHVAFDEGFDVKLLEDAGENQTVIPALYNLHVFNWKCKKCGNEWYMGPQPSQCQLANTDGNRPEHINPNCDGTEFEKVLVFKPRLHKRSEFYRFDITLHFQYHGDRKSHPEAQGEIAETMSAQGSCFMLTREKYWQLNICDEEFGSWGQQGVEVACKTWLSGGQLVTNKKTWYSHMFRTQKGFAFPYVLNEKQVQRAREYSRDLFIENNWPLQIRPLSWLIEKFKPLPDWHDPDNAEAVKLLEYVNKKGEEFYEELNNETGEMEYCADDNFEEIGETIEGEEYDHQPTRSIIYYTDNQLNLKIAHAVKRQLKKIGLPIVSASLKPMDFGKNIVLPYKRGYEAYFKQILAALEASDADIIYFCEHDWLYPPSHFEFTPEDKDTFYYNRNWWRVRSSDGHAVHYDTQLLPGMVGYREALVKHYRKVVEILERDGFTSKNANLVGFEPGTSKRVPELKHEMIDTFRSEFPLIDIRHTSNLTASRWSPDEFRNASSAQNWVENDDEIPGWGKIYGRFEEFLKEI